MDVLVKDDLSITVLQKKKDQRMAGIESGAIEESMGQGILADINKAMSRNGSQMTEISPNLKISTPLCVDEDNKEKNVKVGKNWEKHYIKSVKGGYVLVRYSEIDPNTGEENKYSCYLTVNNLKEILNNGEAILRHIADKAQSGHLFKTLCTRRVAEVEPLTEEQVFS